VSKGEKPTLEDERFAFFLGSGAALAAFLQAKDDRFVELWTRVIPFTKAEMDVAFAHRADLQRAWERAKREPGPFGFRFEEEEDEG
jgi:hypothetical protein